MQPPAADTAASGKVQMSYKTEAKLTTVVLRIARVLITPLFCTKTPKLQGF